MILSVLFTGCGKEFLEEKRDKALVVPTSIADLQALLDDATVTMNTSSGHELGVIGGDEIGLSYESWRDIPNRPFEKNGYIWAKNVYEGIDVNDWNKAYRRILFANTACAGIEKIQPKPSNQLDWNNVKGGAHFFRAYNFYQLAQLFSAPFEQSSAATDLGIPLRLEPDVTLKISRGTNEKVYAQIISDLNLAADLLPEKGINVYRPTKPAAFALLARIYLLMRDYKNARINAEKCLKIRNELNDLNGLNLNASYTFPTLGTNNPEVIFLSYMANISMVTTTRINIAEEVLNLYQRNDLRSKAYFRPGTNGRTLFKGSYTGAATLFTGLAVDEMLLISAECNARLGDISVALERLNQLLVTRYDSNSFSSLQQVSAEVLVDIILLERRRELLLRGTRWEDLRRLNKDAHSAKTLTRNLNGEIFTLPPNDIRYVWPIPDKSIDLGGYLQNPR